MEKVITKIEYSDDNIAFKPIKRRFFRRRVFRDPHIKWMKYDLFDTYEENKQDYYETMDLVYSGGMDIFKAYALHHCAD